MIPDTTVGLVVFLAALGPGYVYIRIAEKRRPRPERSGLLEAVELIVIGAAASTVALLVTVWLADVVGAINAHALASQLTPYFHRNTLAVVGLVLVVLVVAYSLAGTIAWLIYRRESVSIRPAGTSWYDAFWESRPARSDVVVVTVELRDQRRIIGVLRSFSTGLEDSRELGLCAPIGVQAGPRAKPTTTDDRFIVLREADVLAVSGRYVAGATPPRVTRRHRFPFV